MKYEVNEGRENKRVQQIEAEGNRPSLYQIIIHNDDFTPMEFVVAVLERFFYMNRREAAEMMLEAHTKGETICGVYTKEVAETKISQVKEHVRTNEHPLVCSMEVA